ncbi:MAG TPA: hypothetical protein VMS17_27520, partial [Gemmataceae bacterium]|nr:hypothetical protein [Gemmataceae bacterium]
MAKYDLVTFKCRGCDAPLEAQHYTAGQLVSCPRCTQTMTLDVQETPSRNTLQRRGSEDPGVPLKLKLGEAGG